MADTNDQNQVNTDDTQEVQVPADNVEPVDVTPAEVIENTPTLANFRVGDTVVVNYKIKEGEKFRIQPFGGIVIAIRGKGQSKSFTVRRIADGSIGVERIFPLFSPNIDSVVVKTEGNVRRSKLYYLRGRVGKSALKVKTKA